MTNLIILILFLIITLGLIVINKDIINPPVMLSLAWTLPFLWLVVSEGIGQDGYDIDGSAIYYVIGLLIFCIGYYSINRKVSVNIGPFEIRDTKRITSVFKFAIVIELLFTIFFVYDVTKFVMSHFQYNFWFTYKWNVSMGYYTDFFLIPYLRTASRVLICIMSVQFLQKGHYKKDTKWFLLQALITVILNVMGKGRGGIFGFVIPLGVIFILMRRSYSFDTVKIGVKVVCLLCAVFIIYARMKSPYETSQSIPITKTIENYLCGSIVAFCNWINEGNHEWGYGAYTFRFFFALLKGLGFNVNVVTMVEPYVPNINGNIGNVYTFYKWYANDFGLVYALFWQGIVGMIHGWIAKKAYRYKNQKWLIWYAISFYPLIMQFFMDEYMTMLSTWIQIGFWIFLLLNTKLFYVPYDSVGIDNTVRKHRRLRIRR